MERSHLADESVSEGDDRTTDRFPLEQEGPDTEPAPNGPAEGEDVSFDGLEFQSDMVRDPTLPPGAPAAPPPRTSERNAFAPREPRYVTQLPARFGEGVELDTYGSTGNISRRGLELKGRAELSVGGKVSFVLRLPDLTFVRGVGEVIWKKRRRAVCVHGVAVLVADPSYWAFLDKLERE